MKAREGKERGRVVRGVREEGRRDGEGEEVRGDGRLGSLSQWQHHETKLIPLDEAQNDKAASLVMSSRRQYTPPLPLTIPPPSFFILLFLLLLCCFLSCLHILNPSLPPSLLNFSFFFAFSLSSCFLLPSFSLLCVLLLSFSFLLLFFLSL